MSVSTITNPTTLGVVYDTLRESLLGAKDIFGNQFFKKVESWNSSQSKPDVILVENTPCAYINFGVEETGKSHGQQIDSVFRLNAVEIICIVYLPDSIDVRVDCSKVLDVVENTVRRPTDNVDNTHYKIGENVIYTFTAENNQIRRSYRNSYERLGELIVIDQSKFFYGCSVTYGITMRPLQL